MDKLNIIKSFKFRIFPSKVIAAKLENTLYLCQQLYNAALQERKEAYEINRISINYRKQQDQLPEIKQTNLEYADVYCQVLRDVLVRVDFAFQGFFNRVKRKQKAGFPRFRSISRYDSFKYQQSGFSLTANKLKLSKIGEMKIKLSRQIIGKVKTCQIKRETGKWFVIFAVEVPVKPLIKTNKSVGIDVGISAFATLSDGTKIENFKYYEKSQKKLRVAQRSVSRKKKGSSCRRKAVLRLRKIHQKIRNQRNDFAHKISTHLIKNFDLIAIEKLNISGLSKGMFSKQIHDVAWSNFFNMLRYKAVEAGRQLVEIKPAFTSQDCSGCGNRVKKDLSVRVHRCLVCNLQIDRDYNAAINILNKAIGQMVESVKLGNSSCLLSESLI